MSPHHPSRLIRAVEYGTDWSQRVARPIRAFPNRSIEDLLAKPTWSVRSLLPPTSPTTEESEPESTNAEITREKLHHLLKLSALPPPKTAQEEKKMLETLRSQVYFVREIQKVDTTKIEPLVAIRDETSEAVEEQTVRLADLQPWLDREEKVGKNGTVRRRRGSEEARRGIGWDPFALGSGCEEGSGRRMGRWFVVKKRALEKIEPHKAQEADPGKSAG